MQELAENIKYLKDEFKSLGARARIIAFTPGSSFFKDGLLEVSVEEDIRGQYFEIKADRKIAGGLQIAWKNLQSSPYHLVIAAENGSCYLCGVDNGELFVKNLGSVNDVKYGGKIPAKNTSTSFGNYNTVKPVKKPGYDFNYYLLRNVLLKKTAGKISSF